MKNLIFIGAPGSGKGTQSSLLQSRMAYEHISTGNLLRAEIEAGTKLGQKVEETMKSGQLVSDDLVIELIKNNIDLKNKNYIFDGYPRNIEQANTLDQILGSHSYIALYFSVNVEKLVERLESRRMTRDGKHIYNLVSNPPKKSGICDVTGEKLIQRNDDQGEVIRDRMKVFEGEITPLINFYNKRDCYCEINADQSLEMVYESIVSKIS